MKFHGKFSKFTNWNTCRRARHREGHCTLGRRCAQTCALQKGTDFHGGVPGLSPEHVDVQNQLLIPGDIPPACSLAEQLRLECDVNLRYEVPPTHNAPFFSKYAPTARFKFNTSLLRSFLSQTQKGAVISQWVSQFQEDTRGQIWTCQPHGEHTKLGSAENESPKKPQVFQGWLVD